MRVYLDSSALIKRSVEEVESGALEKALDRHVGDDDALVSSSLAWIEVSRALRTRIAGRPRSEDKIQDAVDAALSGVAERLITGDIVALARRIQPTVLRTLDAIHLATAILLDADQVIAYDARLLDACQHHGLATSAPGR